MTTITKRQKLFADKVQPGKSYTLEQALDIVKTCATAKSIPPSARWLLDRKFLALWPEGSRLSLYPASTVLPSAAAAPRHPLRQTHFKQCTAKAATASSTPRAKKLLKP